MTWDGNERRESKDVSLTESERARIFTELGELSVRVSHIEESLAKLDKVSEQLDNYLTQGKGIAKMLQILFYIVGPLVAALYWIKEHVR